MKELELSYNFDNPYVYSKSDKDTYVNLFLELKPGNELRKEEYIVRGIDFCIVLDASGSMNECIEGNVTKIETAVKSIKNLYQFLTSDDSVSLIVYTSRPQVILDHSKNMTKEDFYNAVDKSYSYSGSTNISAALRKSRELLAKNTGNSKKIIFLTDGLPVDDTEEDGIKEGELIGEANISITAFGIGNDFNYAFIENVVKPGRGTTEWIKNPSQSNRVFEQTLKRAKSVVLNEVEIELKVSEKVRINDYYRVTPETTYYGKIQLNREREYRIKLDDIENNRYYRYLFEVAIPAINNPFDGKFKVMTATLRYKIPATNRYEEQKIDITLEMTTDIDKSNYVYQTIKDTAKKCTIQKLDLFLNEYLKQGNDKAVLKVLDEIIETAQDIGEDEIAANYKNIRESYIASRNIPRNLLITASNSSTKINDEGYIEESIDDGLINQIFGND